jgi:3-isopropylmalate/(R)-2-methylmalate dehydratase small subunit
VCRAKPNVPLVRWQKNKKMCVGQKLNLCLVSLSARFFFRNAINNGILLLECPDLPDDVNEGDTVKVELDKQQISANGKTYKIPAIPENLYHIIMDGGLVKSIMKKVEKGLL